MTPVNQLSGIRSLIHGFGSGIGVCPCFVIPCGVFDACFLRIVRNIQAILLFENFCDLIPFQNLFLRYISFIVIGIVVLQILLEILFVFHCIYGLTFYFFSVCSGVIANWVRFPLLNALNTVVITITTDTTKAFIWLLFLWFIFDFCFFRCCKDRVAPDHSMLS